MSCKLWPFSFLVCDPSFSRGGSNEKTVSLCCAVGTCPRLTCDSMSGKKFLRDRQAAGTQHDFSGIGVRKEESQRPPASVLVSQLVIEWILHRLSGQCP